MTNEWDRYVYENRVSYSLSHSSIFALHKDTQGGIWIGTYFGGINYFNPASSQSNYYEANPDDPSALSFPFVGEMAEDKEHNLWICTEGGGLNYFDQQAGRFVRYTHQERSSSGIGNNLVKSRKVLIEKFRNQQEPSTPGNAITQAEQELIDKASLIIKNNFENLEFNMNTLATELGLGRNKLYARIREITGLTPNEFTLKLKLDESIRLLANHKELNISEISDRLGFSSTPYFSKCFKSVFGMSPLAYRKSDTAS